MTDRELAHLQLAIYGQAPDPGWGYHSGSTAVVVWAAKIADDGVTDIVLRGTEDRIDLLLDLSATAVNVPLLGRVHAGFYSSMEWVWKDVQLVTKGPRRFSGHSLGAARATILTGLAVRDGTPPVCRVCWGEPKSGFAELAALIQTVPARSRRNGAHAGSRHHDPITDVPLFLPNFEYVHASALTDVCSPPVGKSEWDLIAWHAMALYAEATGSFILEDK